jgi:hypothetical protein
MDLLFAFELVQFHLKKTPELRAILLIAFPAPIITITRAHQFIKSTHTALNYFCA